MNKSDIIKTLNQYELNKEEFVILAGSAMVMYGIKDTTNDIDIATSNSLYNDLLKKYDCTFEIEINNHKMYIIDDIINFGTSHYEDDFVIIDGFKVQSLESIIETKLGFGREKDLNDCDMIRNYQNKFMSNI